MERSNRETLMSAKSRIDSYRIISELGRGSYGVVFKAIHAKKGGQAVALKFESSNVKKPRLRLEYEILRALKGSPGFPTLLRFKKLGDSRILAMELLGANLESQRKKLGMFTIETTIAVGLELLRRLETLHASGYVHRDLKPENFVNGVDATDHTIYMIDFGLAKRFIGKSGGAHIDFRVNNYLTGTARYCSLNSHNGYELGRRDDLESWCYLLFYFLKGSLPWQGLPGLTLAEKYRSIRSLKLRCRETTLFSDLPTELTEIWHYVTSMSFEQEPDYEFI
jgi:casein kinase 1